MVTTPPFLVIRVGEYSLTAVAVEGLGNFSRVVDTQVALEWQGKVPADVEIMGESIGQVERFVHALKRPLVTENCRIALYVTGSQPTSITSFPRSDSTRELVRGSSLQHFEIKYRGAVGDVVWKWDTPVGAMTIRLESFPTKIDYRTDFESIRAALEEIAPTLTASLSGAAGAGFTPDPGSGAGPLDWLEMVRRASSRLSESMDRLLPRLRTELETSTEIVMSDRLRGARPVSRRAYGAVSDRRRPVQVWKVKQSESTPINGYLRWEVDRLRSMVRAIVSEPWFVNLDSNIATPVRELSRSADQWGTRLVAVPPVRHVPSLDVRLRDPLYERAFRDLRLLWQALQPLRDSEPVGLKDLPTLYEYWVFLKIIQILRLRFPLVLKNSDPLVRRAGSQLVMAAGSRSTVVLEDSDGRRISCQYRRLFLGLPTTDQEPDAIIEIENDDRFLIVDAKYRIGQDPSYVARYGVTGPLAEDINVMHRYRDAIVSREPPYKRLTHSGLIAFPGVESAKYRYHRFFMSWLSVGVGGMPMLPSGTDLIEEAINDYLDKRLEGSAA
jgi:hypothetical protein